MRTLVWSVRGFIFLFLFAFAVKNRRSGQRPVLPETAWQAPLIIVVLAFFAGGAFFGAISLLGTIFGLRREITTVEAGARQREGFETGMIVPPHS